MPKARAAVTTDARVAAILEAALDAIIVMDHTGRVQDWNPAAERTFGYAREEIIGELLAEKIIPPALREMHQRGLARYLATGEAHMLGRRLEVQAVRADGSEFPCELTITALRSEGQPLFTAFLRDLTERRQLEEDNAAAVRRWRLLVEQTPLSVQIFAADGTTVAVNHSWEKLFGTPREKILGWNVLQDPQLAASGAREQIARSFAGEVIVLPPERYDLSQNTQLDRPESAPLAEKWIGGLMYPVQDEKGAVIEVVCIHDDATERRRAENAIRELNVGLERLVAERTAELSRFAAIANTTNDFVGMADMNRRILYVNPAGREMIGWPPAADDEAFTVEDVYPTRAHPRIYEEIIPAALREAVWSGEIFVQHRDGREIPVSMVGMIVRDEAGTPQYMAGIMRDMSERLRVEAELQRTVERERELSGLKSSFVSLVSHEFRTPLGIILSSSEILNLYFAELEAPERREHLDAIKDAVLRMSALMEEVLFFSRVEANKILCVPLQLDLPGLCQRLRDEACSATAGRCPIEWQAENDLAGARADEALVRHIVSNLLSNAVKYSAEGLSVSFSARREGNEACFQITDRGLGIPADAMPQLFTAFYRGGNVSGLPGTGLGLSIVKKCVDLHGGGIAVESQEGVGTTVQVRLPLFVESGNI